MVFLGGGGLICFTNCWERGREQAGAAEVGQLLACLDPICTSEPGDTKCLTACEEISIPRRGSPHALDPPPNSSCSPEASLLPENCYFSPSSLSIALQRREKQKGSPLSLPFSRFITNVRTRDFTAPLGNLWELCGSVCVCVCIWQGWLNLLTQCPSAPLQNLLFPHSLFSEIIALRCRLFFVCHMLVNFCFTFFPLVIISLSLGERKDISQFILSSKPGSAIGRSPCPVWCDFGKLADYPSRKDEGQVSESYNVGWRFA